MVIKMQHWFTVILLLLLFFAILFYTINYNRIFQPTKKISKFVIEPSEDVLVDGIWVAHFKFNEENPTILFCHGNSGNVTNRSYMVQLCKMAGLNLVMFDYSGYGKSDGNARTRRLLYDGEKVLDWISKKVDQDKIIIWGESLGGSVASYLASKNKCSKLVLFATFSSLNDLAFGETTWWKMPIQSFLNVFVHPLPTKMWVESSNVPTLIVHSKDDELISVNHARNMKDIDQKRIQLMEIEGGHGTPKLSKDNIQRLFNFCGVNKVDYIDGCMEIFDRVNKEIWTE
jgi:pimeloyl-ACP methyl ester carboxylesterase